jgi:hypothetical protein
MRTDCRSIIITLTLAAALLLASVPLQAQDTLGNWSRLSSVETGAKLAVKLKNGKTVDGRFNSISDSALTLKVKGSNQELRKDDIQTIHLVTRKSATKATLIGAGIGAGAGALAGAVGGREGDFDKLDQAVTAGFTVIGAGIGALSGYLIGRTGRKRELIYQAR